MNTMPSQLDLRCPLSGFGRTPLFQWSDFGAVFLFFLVVLAPVSVGYAADGDGTIRLLVEDVMVHPGNPAQLESRLMQDGPAGGKGLAGEIIQFEVHGKKAGSAVTGEDGRATIEFTTHMRGNQVIRGIAKPSGKIRQTEGIGNLASWERRRPLLLVDLETVFRSPASPRGLSSSASLTQQISALGEAAEHAASELLKLSQYYYNIIYLYHGDSSHRDAIRIWLQEQRFPPGITKLLSPGKAALQDFIGVIKEQGWDTIEAGIGVSKDFAEVLLKNRIATVILRPVPVDEKFPRRTKFVTDWEKIRRHL